MKKFLLGTSALIGVVAVAGAAHAGGPAGSVAGSGPSVTVGGFLDFQAGIPSQDGLYENEGTASVRSYNFTNDAEIHISVEGKADNGIGYGAVIELNTNTDADAEGDSGAGNADKTYLFIESSAGRVELGNNSSATKALGVSAGSIARATGGIDGDFHRYIDLDGVNTGSPAGDTGLVNSVFIVTSDLSTDTPAGNAPDATKITYYTPRFSGAQLGVSFTPDTADTGTATALSLETEGTGPEELFNIGVNYQADVSGVGVTASLTGEFGSSEVVTVEDTSGWALGLQADYQNFSVAGSWVDYGDSGLATTAVADEQNLWTLGAAYETGPFGLSVTYLESEGSFTGGATDSEFSNLVLSADYQLAPGLVPYVEVALFDTDDNVAANVDNDGSVVLIGAELNF